MRTVIYRYVYFIPDPFQEERHEIGVLVMFCFPKGGQQCGSPHTEWIPIENLPRLDSPSTEACRAMGIDCMNSRNYWSMHNLPRANGPHFVLGPVVQSETDNVEEFRAALTGNQSVRTSP